MKTMMNLQQSVDAASLGKVAVLMGGSSAEREVSLMSGKGVLEALVSRGVEALAFDPAEQDLSQLKAMGIQRCFIALHGRLGEDGAVQGALEWLRIPYTGSGIMASAIAMDKVMTKRLWRPEGLPLPKEVVLGAADLQPERRAQSLAAAIQTLGLPLIVKPSREGSSIGVSKVQSGGELEAAVALAASLDGQVLCEELIQGMEVTCPVIGEGDEAIALPVIRIAPPEEGYDYQNKYFTDEVKYHCPSGLPAQEEAEIQRIVLQAYRTLGCRGWGRADLMVRGGDRQAFLLEMNTSPGMTSHSLVPMSARAAGLDYASLCLLLLAHAGLDART
jgi:D-alanine-D-alanine ligase